MKKLLLLAGVALSAASPALAIQEVVPGQYLTKLSPDGKWTAGLLEAGSVVIRNLISGDSFEYFTDGEGGVKNYYVANGATPISNTGIVLGATNMEDASYWEDGEWHALPVINPMLSNSARSITPDGSVICGDLGQTQMSVDATDIMTVPAVWYRGADGSYSEPEVLPHPRVDFTGRLPQYITTYAISADGNTVVGQIMDYAGFMTEPIVYTRGENGEWSYSTPYTRLLNVPEGGFPEYPGEFDEEMPVEEWFMTAEELAAFQEALEEWINSSPDDDLPSPEYADYMTDEEAKAYSEAYADYYSRFSVWQRQWEAYEAAYSGSKTDGYSLVFNNIFLTPDGRYFLATRTFEHIDDPFEGPVKTYQPVVLSTDGKEVYDLDSSYPALSMMSTAIAEDGTVLTTYYDPDNILPQRAYAIADFRSNTEAIPLEDFIGESNPEAAAWMKENMTHSVVVGATALGFTFEDYMCSGWAVCTPSLDTLLCAVGTYTWQDEKAPEYFSYVLSTGMDVKVEAVAGDGSSFTVLPGGDVKVEGNFSALDVYDIAGSRILSVVSPAGTVATGLSEGIYIFRATCADGSALTRKAAVR